MCVCVSLQSPQSSLSSQVDPFKTQWRITFSSGRWLQPAQKKTKALILPWHSVCLCLRECVFSYFMQATQVTAYNCPSISVCMCVSVRAGGSDLSSQGQVGGIRPLSSVEWLWIGFGSGLNLLTDTSSFSPQDQKRDCFHSSLTHHIQFTVIWASPWPKCRCECVQTHTSLPLYAFFSPLSHFHNHWIICKTIIDPLHNNPHPHLSKTANHSSTTKQQLNHKPLHTHTQREKQTVTIPTYPSPPQRRRQLQSVYPAVFRPLIKPALIGN